MGRWREFILLLLTESRTRRQRRQSGSSAITVVLDQKENREGGTCGRRKFAEFWETLRMDG